MLLWNDTRALVGSGSWLPGYLNSCVLGLPDFENYFSGLSITHELEIISADQWLSGILFVGLTGWCLAVPSCNVVRSDSRSEVGPDGASQNADKAGNHGRNNNSQPQARKGRLPPRD